ncbi:hypothetical protein IHE61_26110 [Streptomyces sp. GKU 257-1]|nr:hypothetical protein [Streptomyces sp. GKU 257-1]
MRVLTDARGITLTTTYDALGRKTARKEGDDTVRAAWSYDKEAKGQLDSTVRHVDGDAYTSTVTGYTDRYQPSGTTVTIPGAEGSLAGSYSWRYFYNAETGARTGFDQPSAGGLPSERMATGFTADGLPTSLSAGGVPLVNDTAYDPLAHPVRTEHGLRGRKLYETRDWDEHTGRLTRDTVDGAGRPPYRGHPLQLRQGPATPRASPPPRARTKPPPAMSSASPPTRCNASPPPGPPPTPTSPAPHTTGQAEHRRLRPLLADLRLRQGRQPHSRGPATAWARKRAGTTRTPTRSAPTPTAPPANPAPTPCTR